MFLSSRASARAPVRSTGPTKDHHFVLPLINDKWDEEKSAGAYAVLCLFVVLEVQHVCVCVCVCVCVWVVVIVFSLQIPHSRSS